MGRESGTEKIKDDDVFQYWNKTNCTGTAFSQDFLVLVLHTSLQRSLCKELHWHSLFHVLYSSPFCVQTLAKNCGATLCHARAYGMNSGNGTIKAWKAVFQKCWQHISGLPRRSQKWSKSNQILSAEKKCALDFHSSWSFSGCRSICFTHAWHGTALLK